jgi:hypothetical protein
MSLLEIVVVVPALVALGLVWRVIHGRNTYTLDDPGLLACSSHAAFPCYLLLDRWNEFRATKNKRATFDNRNAVTPRRFTR